MCGSKWESLSGALSAFKYLGSSTARYGCCPANKYMSSPEGTGTFIEADSCSACPAGQAAYSSLGSCTRTWQLDSCSDCGCEKRHFVGININVESCKAKCISSAAAAGEVCGSIFGGSDGSCWWCNSKFTKSVVGNEYTRYNYICPNDDTSCKINSCPATQVLNSDKAATDSLTGAIDASVTITCDPGWSGSGTTVCDKDLQWNPVRVCSVNSCSATQITNSDKADAKSITGKSNFFFCTNNFNFPQAHTYNYIHVFSSSTYTNSLAHFSYRYNWTNNYCHL